MRFLRAVVLLPVTVLYLVFMVARNVWWTAYEVAGMVEWDDDGWSI